jgi:uncharacterized protein (TIGR02145 family)
MKNQGTAWMFGILMVWMIPGPELSSQTPGETLVDPRDGQSYATIQIGDQHWMAENLNYDHPESTCYDNEPLNCDLLGRLYTWEIAQEVCPNGWHLPSRGEWDQLSEYLGRDDAGQKLKAAREEDPLGWDGNNASGFTALPAGAGNGEGFHRKGNWALFWSATAYNDSRAWFAQLDGYWYPAPPKYKNLYLGWYYLKSNQFSIRCLKDNP